MLAKLPLIPQLHARSHSCWNWGESQGGFLVWSKKASRFPPRWLICCPSCAAGTILDSGSSGFSERVKHVMVRARQREPGHGWYGTLNHRAKSHGERSPSDVWLKQPPRPSSSRSGAEVPDRTSWRWRWRWWWKPDDAARIVNYTRLCVCVVATYWVPKYLFIQQNWGITGK